MENEAVELDGTSQARIGPIENRTHYSQRRKICGGHQSSIRDNANPTQEEREICTWE